MKYILVLYSMLFLLSCSNTTNKNKKIITDEKSLKTLVEYEDFCRYCHIPSDFDLALKQPDSVSTVRLTNPSLKSIDNLFLFKNLKMILINDCDSITLNYFFQKASMFKNIDELYFDNCELYVIPDQIGLFTSLTSLDIINDSIYIEQVSDSISLLKDLMILRINVIKFPNALTSLNSLEVLAMNIKNSKKLSKGICNLISLKKLSLGEDVIEIPNEIKKLKNLEILDITLSTQFTKNEFDYHSKHYKFNQIAKVKQLLPNCRVRQMKNYY